MPLQRPILLRSLRQRGWHPGATVVAVGLLRLGCLHRVFNLLRGSRLPRLDRVQRWLPHRGSSSGSRQVREGVCLGVEDGTLLLIVKAHALQLPLQLFRIRLQRGRLLLRSQQLQLRRLALRPCGPHVAARLRGDDGSLERTDGLCTPASRPGCRDPSAAYGPSQPRACSRPPRRRWVRMAREVCSLISPLRVCSSSAVAAAAVASATSSVARRSLLFFVASSSCSTCHVNTGRRGGERPCLAAVPQPAAPCRSALPRAALTWSSALRSGSSASAFMTRRSARSASTSAVALSSCFLLGAVGTGAARAEAGAVEQSGQRRAIGVGGSSAREAGRTSSGGRCS